MKNRSSIWLLISTFVLCLGVMTFGVYSVLSGTLNINGTLGFNMHNATVTVSGTIQNVAMTTDNWASATRETITIERTVMGGENTTITNLNLGALYFHAGYNMVFDFTFTNISETSVIATIPIPTVGNGVTVLHNDDEKGYTDLSADYTTIIKANDLITIRFALSIESGSNSFIDVGFNWLNIQFVKFSVKEVTVHTFENPIAGTFQAKFPYYIEFGKLGQTSLKWAVIGVDSGNDTMAALTDDDKSMLASGYMPSNKNYYLLSENALYTESAENYELSFQNQYTNDSTENYANAYGKNANDYATSNIRAYLNGASDIKYGAEYNSGSPATYTPKDGTEVDPFTTTYTFTPVETEMIQAREVSALMAGLSVSSGTISTDAPTGAKPDSVAQSIHDALTQKTADKTADNFWLLSHAEVQTVFGVGQGSSDASLSTTVQSTTTTCSWWLRSPYIFNMSVWSVNRYGSVGSGAVDYSFGVRPAFKI